MKLLDHTWPTPAENLAADEALLEEAESRAGDTVLRFWESPVPFVVVGYSNHLAREVNLPACQARGVPVLRRCSGGGTVVQGPGCLNYALVLRMTDGSPLSGLTETNRHIMTRHRDALARVLGRPVTFDGHTDLAIDGRKISGNAQRRKRRFLLFHGTFLVGFDLALIETVLRFPSRQPDYRQSRSHMEFVTNLAIPAQAIKQALIDEWSATTRLIDPPRARVAALVREKYGTTAWNERL